MWGDAKPLVRRNGNAHAEAKAVEASGKRENSHRGLRRPSVEHWMTATDTSDV